MYYYDGSTIQMGHNTYINHEKVMESIGSVISAQRKYNTKYHGGVFLLQENDTISVRIPYTMHFHMDSEGSFFGVFLLKNTAIQGEQMYFKHMYKNFVLLHLCSNSRTYKLILATYNSWGKSVYVCMLLNAITTEHNIINIYKTLRSQSMPMPNLLLNLFI